MHNLNLLLESKDAKWSLNFMKKESFAKVEILFICDSLRFRKTCKTLRNCFKTCYSLFLMLSA